MAVSNELADAWLCVLEDMLHDADVAGATKFAIHINSAIEQLHADRASLRTLPRADYVPDQNAKS